MNNSWFKKIVRFIKKESKKQLSAIRRIKKWLVKEKRKKVNKYFSKIDVE